MLSVCHIPRKGPQHRIHIKACSKVPQENPLSSELDALSSVTSDVIWRRALGTVPFLTQSKTMRYCIARSHKLMALVESLRCTLEESAIPRTGVGKVRCSPILARPIRVRSSKVRRCLLVPTTGQKDAHPHKWTTGLQVRAGIGSVC